MSRFSSCIVLILVSPYLLSFVQIRPDSASTEVGFAVGGGSYSEVTRDCNGNVLGVENVPFGEAAASVDHYTPALHVGVRTGIIVGEAADKIFTLRQTTPAVFYATPIVGLNTTSFGLDLGYVFPFHQDMLTQPGGIPAGSLRLGRKDAFHFRIRLADDLPLVTGGSGIGNLGFVWNLGKPNQSLWFGVGGSPYDALAVGTQVEFPISDAALLRFAGSIGTGKETEYGISAGARIRF